jgi:hypothetical protein
MEDVGTGLNRLEPVGSGRLGQVRKGMTEGGGGG